MAKHELLNNITHKNLKIITEKSARYGDNVAGALILPEEFTAVQREYPIVFQKDAQSGEFQAVALFGFQENENLFLDANGWNANYIPAIMEREPFLIGFQASQDSPEGRAPVIHVDMENPRISASDEGQPVFLEQGGNTPYIEKIGKILELIHQGLAVSQDMFKAFLAAELIEPLTLEVEFNNGDLLKITDYYTINQERLFTLDDAFLGKLHRAGYLNYAFLVVASLGNVRKLVNLKEARRLQSL